MYRRLKNILGVSLIIFAIVLSQIPMGDVLADEDTIMEDVSIGEDVDEGEGENAKDSIEGESSQDVGNEENVALLTTGNEGSGTLTEGIGDSIDENSTPTENTDSTSNGDTTSIKEIKITYNLGLSGVSLFAVADGSQVNGSSITLEIDSKIGIKVPKPTKIVIDGDTDEKELVVDAAVYKIGDNEYRFKGWYANSNSSGVEWNFNEPITNDVTIYAAWAAENSVEYTVTFSAAGFEPSTQQIKVVGGTTVPIPVASTEGFTMPIKEGHRILHWLDETGSKVEEWDFLIDKDRNFTAVTDATSYEVTFHMKDGATYDGEGSYAIQIPYNSTIETAKFPDESKIMVLCLPVVFHQQRDLPGIEKIHRLFAHRQNYGILSFHVLIGQFQNIAVIAAGQAAVTGHHHIGRPLYLPCRQVGGGQILGGIHNVPNGGKQNFKIRTGGLHLGLGPAELGGGHHFHSLGDLLGGFHAPYAVFDFLGGNTSHLGSLLLLRRGKLAEQLRQRGFQFFFGILFQLAAQADGVQDVAVAIVHKLLQRQLELRDLLHGDVLQIATHHRVDDAHLVGNINGSVVALLQNGDDTLTQRQTRLGIGVQVGAELGEGLQLTVLRIQQLQGAGNLLHGLDLGGAADTGDGDTGVNGGHDAGVE